MIIYTSILTLTNIFTLKKSSAFANLRMEKPGIDLLLLHLKIENLELFVNY